MSKAKIGIGIALVTASGCANDHRASLREQAESYECTASEAGLMRKYYAACMDGAGYFSNYCLDRAVVAMCHRREANDD